ncbi:hypothetical protein LF1_05660 [Rubripirellula obstinata]|uniref:DUF2924 domain-containing protein n=1 Tax=Rubripirellula obstinata TaxID=406547 RepID=A0A5B1CCT9_9BACT|nr:DUF2924 domain-containing protein [Rubripirellula obstinata]KAA1258051.1 hypothetical protein LF1_05660 [Rubripirellula obstinata]
MSPETSFAIAELADLTIDQLVAKYEEVHQEKCRSRNRLFLVRRVAWRIQANEEGGLSERALLRAGPIADESVIRVTPPKPKSGRDVVRTQMPPNWDARIPPPGSFLERRYKGKIRRVLILTDGFEYQDERFDSLSFRLCRVGTARAISFSVVSCPNSGRWLGSFVICRVASLKSCSLRFGMNAD